MSFRLTSPSACSCQVRADEKINIEQRALFCIWSILMNIKSYTTYSRSALPCINCSFLQANDEIMAPYGWSILKSDIGWFIAWPEASWSFPLNSGKSTLSLIWKVKILIRKAVVVWEKRKKIPLLEVFMTFATDFCNMGKSCESFLILSSCCMSKGGKTS